MSAYMQFLLALVIATVVAHLTLSPSPAQIVGIVLGGGHVGWYARGFLEDL